MARKSYRSAPRRIEQSWVGFDASNQGENSTLFGHKGNFAIHPEGSTNVSGSRVSFLTAGDVANGEYSCKALRPFTILATHAIATIAAKDQSILTGWIALGIGSSRSQAESGVPIISHPRIGYNEGPGHFPAVFPAIDFGGAAAYELGPTASSKGRRRVEIGDVLYGSWSGIQGAANGDILLHCSFRVLCRLA